MVCHVYGANGTTRLTPPAAVAAESLDEALQRSSPGAPTDLLKASILFIAARGWTPHPPRGLLEKALTNLESKEYLVTPMP